MIIYLLSTWLVLKNPISSLCCHVSFFSSSLQLVKDVTHVFPRVNLKPHSSFYFFTWSAVLGDFLGFFFPFTAGSAVGLSLTEDLLVVSRYARYFLIGSIFCPTKSSALQCETALCFKINPVVQVVNEALVVGSLLPLCLNLMDVPWMKWRMAGRERNSFVSTATVTFGWG